MIKNFYERYKNTNWFWYFVLIIIGTFAYKYQSIEYKSIFHVSLLTSFLNMLAYAFAFLILHAISGSIFQALADDKNDINLDFNKITPFYIITVISFLIFAFFPLKLQNQALITQMNKINFIVDDANTSNSRLLNELFELSDVYNILPQKDHYDEE
ncbi:MAG: hypothetical protein V8R83_09605 [Candidatus Gastranaerophilaceae bacterium]